jgi:hypothetical protein
MFPVIQCQPLSTAELHTAVYDTESEALDIVDRLYQRLLEHVEYGTSYKLRKQFTRGAFSFHYTRTNNLIFDNCVDMVALITEVGDMRFQEIVTEYAAEQAFTAFAKVRRLPVAGFVVIIRRLSGSRSSVHSFCTNILRPLMNSQL